MRELCQKKEISNKREKIINGLLDQHFGMKLIQIRSVKDIYYCLLKYNNIQ